MIRSLVRRLIPSPYFDLDRFFVDALTYQWRQREATDIPAPWGAYYEFGVGAGGTMRRFFRAWRTVTRRHPEAPAPAVVGFDTFTGLPASDHPADRNPAWTPGAFRSPTHLLETLPWEARRVGLEPLFIAGRFEQSLTARLRQALVGTPPGLVTIDVDYYTSTRDVLAFLDPLLRPGALLYFDDVWASNGDPALGQRRAIAEYCASSNLRIVPHWLGRGSEHVWVVVR